MASTFTSIPVLTLSIKAIATLVANRFVTMLGAAPAAGANAVGVTRSAAAIGEMVSADALGTCNVEAGAAIAAGALIESDASGRAITRTTGAILGRAVTAAAATGELIEMFNIPN